jgi:hypothetical protein
MVAEWTSTTCPTERAVRRTYRTCRTCPTRRSLRTLPIAAALAVAASLSGCGLFDTLDEIDNAIFRPHQRCCDRYGDVVDWIGQQSIYARTCPCEMDEKRAYWNRPKFARIPDQYKVISQIGNKQPDSARGHKPTESAPPPAVDDGNAPIVGPSLGARLR